MYSSYSGLPSYFVCVFRMATLTINRCENSEIMFLRPYYYFGMCLNYILNLIEFKWRINIVVDDFLHIDNTEIRLERK